nr:hypothetical protein [Bacilli bacterium]
MGKKIESFLKSIGISETERYDLDFVLVARNPYKREQVDMAIEKETPWNYPLLEEFLSALANIHYPYTIRFSYPNGVTCDDVCSLFSDWHVAHYYDYPAFPMGGEGESVLVAAFETKEQMEKEDPKLREFEAMMSFFNYEFTIKRVMIGGQPEPQKEERVIPEAFPVHHDEPVAQTSSEDEEIPDLTSEENEISSSLPDFDAYRTYGQEGENKDTSPADLPVEEEASPESEPAEEPVNEPSAEPVAAESAPEIEENLAEESEAVEESEPVSEEAPAESEEMPVEAEAVEPAAEAEEIPTDAAEEASYSEEAATSEAISSEEAPTSEAPSEESHMQEASFEEAVSSENQYTFPADSPAEAPAQEEWVAEEIAVSPEDVQEQEVPAEESVITTTEQARTLIASEHKASLEEGEGELIKQMESNLEAYREAKNSKRLWTKGNYRILNSIDEIYHIGLENVDFDGIVFESTAKLTRKGKMSANIGIGDSESAVNVRAFENAKMTGPFLEGIKVGQHFRIRGSIDNDRFTGQKVVIAHFMDILP